MTRRQSRQREKACSRLYLPQASTLITSVLTFHLDGVFASPLASSGLVPGAVGLVDVGDLGNQRIVGVGVGQHGADRQEDWDKLVRRLELTCNEGVLTFRDGQSRAPLVSQDVQADAAARVDVGVVDAGGEVDLGRLEGVVGREVDGEEENTAGVWEIGRAHV